MTLFEAAVDDIAEQVTVKRMLAGYGDGAYGGATGPSHMELGKRKDAKHKSISSRINEDIRSDNEMSAVDAQSGCSPPRKRKQIFKSIQFLLGKGRIRNRGLVTGRTVTMKYKPHQMKTMETKERGIHDMYEVVNLYLH